MAPIDTQQDWANREFVNSMHAGMVKLVAFLNRFEAEARYKLAVVNEKLTGLERKAEMVEATMKHCRPEKRGAKSSPVQGTVYDPEWREQEMARKTQRIATTRNQILPKKIYAMKAAPGGFRRVISLQTSQRTEEKDGIDMYPAPKKMNAPVETQVQTQGGPMRPRPVAASPAKPGPPPPGPGAGGPPPGPPAAMKPPPGPGGPPKRPPKTAFIGDPKPGPPKPPPGPGAMAAPPPAPSAAKPPPAPVPRPPAAASGPPGPPPGRPAPGGEGEGEGEGSEEEDYSDDPDMPEFNPPVSNKGKMHVQRLAPPKPNGKAVKDGDPLVVAYTGWIANNGSFFDQHEEFELTMGSGDNIQGLEELLLAMKEGQRVLAYIPAHKGYGKDGAGDVIPPDANLVFDLQLLTVG